MASVLPIPAGPQIDPRTGALSEEWRRYYQALEDALAGDTAPRDAQYYVATSDADLTNERNLGALSSGFLKITTAAGIATPSTVSGITSADFSGQLSVANGGTGANLSATGGASQVLKQTSAGAAITVGQVSSSDISGLPTLAAGTYTPTIFASVNMTFEVASTAQYLRVGNVVTVSGRVGGNVTTLGVDTSLQLSFPVTSALSTSAEIGGAATLWDITTNALTPVWVDLALDGSDRYVYLWWIAGSTSSCVVDYHYTYLIV